jgi:hypothetical protein
VDVFEEVCKLIFTKLYDEMDCFRGRHKYLRFRNSNTAARFKANIQDLCDDARKQWPGVFSEDEKIKLRLQPVCELMNLHTSASLYPAISEADLWAIPIPRITPATQTEVTANVRAAQASRRRAHALLEAAKRAVEIAIEDSEAAAFVNLDAARAG